MLRPLNKLVLVEPIKRDNTFAGGSLILPEGIHDHFQRGTIIAVSEQIENKLTVGDVVLMASGVGSEVRDEGQLYLLVNENNILAVVE